MLRHSVKLFLFFLSLVAFTNAVEAQKVTAKKRAATKKVEQAPIPVIAPAVADTVAPAVVIAPPPKQKVDSLPIPKIKKSLRPDNGYDTEDEKKTDRLPLPYEHLRADDAVYRHKIWREIDTREKFNLPFKYAANEDNGNQRFAFILMKLIQDSSVTAFDAIDDRFTTPMTKSQVNNKISGGVEMVDILDSLGISIGKKEVTIEINPDSFYKFRIKEEVIFDKESSRLFWRILGIALVKRTITSVGMDLGESELFWIYYPDLRPFLAKYEVYNGKNFGARMTWEDLFEGRMFSGRIIKSTIDNPFDLPFKDQKGLKESGVFQLLEGERIKEKIFSYEQDLWKY
jgi:gliding motility associated protien GldN